MVGVVLTVCCLSASKASMSVPHETILSVIPTMKIHDVMQGKNEDGLIVSMKYVLFG